MKKSKKTPSYGYFTPPRAKKRSQYDGAENFLHLWGARETREARDAVSAFLKESLAKNFPLKRLLEEPYSNMTPWGF